MFTQGDLAACYREGRRLFRSWSKRPSQATGSGIWFDLSMSPGNPTPQYYAGVELTATALTRSANGGLDHGPNMPGYQKFLHKFDIQTSSGTAVPLTVELNDYLMFYPFVPMEGVNALANPITLPRSTDGDGVQIMLVEQFSYGGSATCRLTYTNSDGVAGRLSPIITLNTQTVTGTIASSGSLLPSPEESVSAALFSCGV